MAATQIKPSKSLQNVWAPEAGPASPNPELEVIPLTIGDPSYGGILHPPKYIEDVILKNVKSNMFNGYERTRSGLPSSREAIAKKANNIGSPVTPNDVIITCGCSQALDMVFNSITSANDDDEYVFLPKPSFFLYRMICDTHYLKYVYYNLNPDDEWNIDLDDLEAKLQNYKCKLLVMCNPMNPTGSVFSKEHLFDFLNLAEKYNVTVLTDEVYNNLTWGGKEFIPLASLKSNVPIIEVNSLSKQFMYPGLRTGWVVFHSKGEEKFNEVKRVFKSINLTEGPPAVFQSLIPHLLNETPDSYFEMNNAFLAKIEKIAQTEFKECPALTYIPSFGAMYCMPKVNLEKLDIKSTVEFAKKLLEEQSVSVFPGEAFEASGYLRIVLVQSQENFKEACSRIKKFCLDHTN